jgi:hypothetical protein
MHHTALCNTNGGGSRPLVPIADFREIIDFKKENLRSSTAPRVSVWGRWYKRLIGRDVDEIPCANCLSATTHKADSFGGAVY